MKSLAYLLAFLPLACSAGAQPASCRLLNPVITIHFGTGNVRDVNTEPLLNYYRVSSSCPTDGHYSYVPATSNCFGDDWHTLTQDHTPGDVDGNMMLVNGAPNPGVVLKTTITGLKAATNYQFGIWLMNLCKPSDKCPYPLLPNLSICLEAENGKAVAQFSTGDLQRVATPRWNQYTAMFTTPASATSLTLIITNSAPGGCGNDFAVDDINLRECVKITTTTGPPVVKSKLPAATRPAPKRTVPEPVKKEAKTSQIAKPAGDSSIIAISAKRPTPLPPPPLILTTRENALVKRIETEAGQIRIDLYDNGEIDGDTVTIYHNNALLKAHAGLTAQPISFTLNVDAEHPHHELIMVADNLGSIPPNTSVMIITAGNNRYQVFISSTEQTNAKVVLDLKKQ